MTGSHNFYFCLVAFAVLVSYCAPSNEPSAVQKKPDTVWGHEPVTPIDKRPPIAVNIKLGDTLFDQGEKIPLTIRITNTGPGNQKLLLDKPSLSTGGPWHTTADVIDLNTKLSIVEEQNKAVLISQLFTEEDFKDSYYELQPGQSISANYYLTDIVLLDTKGYSLPTGSYELHPHYYGVPANVLRFSVK